VQVVPKLMPVCIHGRTFHLIPRQSGKFRSFFVLNALQNAIKLSKSP
jgi:hypothetical protein